MIKGIHHVALRCSNIENYRETLDFYENLMGMKVRYLTLTYAYCMGPVGEVIEFYKEN